MTRISRLGRLFCLVWLGIGLVLASVPGPAGAGVQSTPRIFGRVQEFRLDNGMLFLMLPRHGVPMVSGNIMVRVGNVDNPEGSTGLAHLFEHMAFKGTDVIGSKDYPAEASVLDSLAVVGERLAAARRAQVGEDDNQETGILATQVEALEKRANEFNVPMAFPQTYERYTFDFNAYTNTDVTAYTTTFPTNNLEVWMLMESERIKHPVFREFYSELAVVEEERRSRTGDKPEAMARELLTSLVFTKHPYRFPTIGYMKDLTTLTPRMLHQFHDQYYLPGNMVGVLVGDFDPDQAREMIENYFGNIPVGPAPPEVTMVEPAQTAPRHGVHAQGSERRLLMAFPGFGPRDPQWATAGLLASILARGRTSRLLQRLDFQEGVGRSIWAEANGGYWRYPGMFLITVDVMGDHTNQEVEKLVWDVLGEVVSDPVTVEELDEIRSSYSKGFLFRLQRNKGLADMLASYQVETGDWSRCYRRFDDYDRVTPQDITALAAAIFQPELATTVYLEPASSTIDTNGGQP